MSSPTIRLLPMHLTPGHADLLAILDRIMGRIGKRMGAAQNDEDVAELEIELAAHAITTLPHNGRSDHAAAMRGAERGRAWSDGFSLHAGVVIDSHDRAALWS